MLNTSVEAVYALDIQVLQNHSLKRGVQCTRAGMYIHTVNFKNQKSSPVPCVWLAKIFKCDILYFKEEKWLNRRRGG
jgi:hypothetical protein